MNGINPKPGEWNQETHPYRLSWTVPSSVTGNHGWASRSLVYHTEQAARDDVTNIKGRLRRSKVYIHAVTNPGPRWKWRHIATFS